MHCKQGSVLCYWFSRGCYEQTKVYHLVAYPAVAVLHCAKLWQATLGAVLHALLLPLHSVDSRVLLRHGVDGKCTFYLLQCMSV